MIQNMTGAGGGDIDSIIDDDAEWTDLECSTGNTNSVILKVIETNKRIYVKGSIYSDTGGGYFHYDYSKCKNIGGKYLPCFAGDHMATIELKSNMGDVNGHFTTNNFIGRIFIQGWVDK